MPPVRPGDSGRSARRASSGAEKPRRRETQALHRICHRQIHALFSEAELEKSYATVEALLEHEEMRKFVAWVVKKPPGFFDGTKRSNRRR